MGGALIGLLIVLPGVFLRAQVPDIGRAGRLSETVPETKTDPDLTERAYSIAEEAIREKQVPRKAREDLARYVLPALRARCVAIINVSERDIPGSAAVYDDELDAVKTPGIDLKDPDSRARTLHELIHVAQDGAKRGQMREDSEQDAYAVQVEYLMRGKGLLHEEADGSVAIKANEIGSLGQLEKFLVYGYAAANIKKGRAELNDFSDSSGLKFKGDASHDVRQYFVGMAETMESSAKNEWAMATNFSAMSGSGVRNTKEFLAKDGLKRCR